MDELLRLQSLKKHVKERAARAQEELARTQEELQALELVERLLAEQRRPDIAEQVSPKRYKTMSQIEAIDDVLKQAAQTMTAAAVAGALQRGGFPFTSKDPKNPVYAALKQNRRNTYFNRKDGLNVVFGLKKWNEVEADEAVQ